MRSLFSSRKSKAKKSHRRRDSELPTQKAGGAAADSSKKKSRRQARRESLDRRKKDAEGAESQAHLIELPSESYSPNLQNVPRIEDSDTHNTSTSPVKQVPAEQTSVAQEQIEQLPVEEAPVEKAPVEKVLGKPTASVKEASVETAPGEKVPVEQAAAKQTPACQPAVASPPNTNILSSEAATLSSEDSNKHAAYWYRALERLSESEKRTIETLATKLSQSGVGGEETVIQSILNDKSSSRLSSLISERVDRIDDKAWKFRFRGRNIILRDLANKVLTWLTKFKAVGDIAVQYDPVHAALPWAAIRFLLQESPHLLPRAATAEQELAGHMLIGTEKASYLLTRCQIYRKLYLDESNDRKLDSSTMLETTLVALYSEILSMLAHLIKLTNRSLASRTFHVTLNPSALSDRMTKLETLESRIEADASNCERESRSLSDAARDMQFETLHNLFSQHIALSEANRLRYFDECRVNERCDILQWISDIQYESDHYNCRLGRTKGTGQWLLDDEVYRDWRNTSASICLWLHGIPGAGKTKLATKVVDHLLSSNSSDEGLAYFFCDRNRENHKDPIWVLRTFVRQLAASQSDTTIVKFVRDKYIEMKTRGFASSLTIEDCAALLLELTNIFPQTIFILDGLDECEKETRHSIMDTMDATMKNAGHPVKIFISSREHEDIAGRYSQGDHLKVTASRNQSDIEKFVSDEMQSSRYCRNRMQQNVRKKVLNTFREKSDGMFQWAALHIRELLSFERDSDVLKYLNDLPFGIKGAYDKIYERIESQKGGKRQIAITAMKVLICTHRSLTPGELAIAACQDPDGDFNENIDIDPMYMLDACQNLVDVFHSGPCHPRFASAEETQLLHRVLDKKSNAGASSNSLGPSQKPAEASSTTIKQSGNTIDYGLFCRFSHLSVVEYLTEKWGIHELYAHIARVCLRTLLRFSIPYPSSEYHQTSAPVDCPISNYWPLSDAYNRIEKVSRWHFHQQAWESVFPMYAGARGVNINNQGGDRQMPNLPPKPPTSVGYYRQDVQGLLVQAPIMWLRHAVSQWYYYMGRSINGNQASEQRDILHNLIERFYGHPFHGSPGYRSWVILVELLFCPNLRNVLDLVILYNFQRFIPAFWCAASGDLHCLIHWLDQGVLDPNLSSINFDGYNAMGLRVTESFDTTIIGDHFGLLYTAAYNHQGAICHELISRGAVQDADSGSEAVIERAIRNGWDDIVRILLESGLDVRQKYSRGPLLNLAAYGGTLGMVRTLLRRGAQLDLCASMFHFSWHLTPLEVSCLRPHGDDIALYLIRKVSNINADHPLALLLAALTGKTAVVRSLVYHGADVDGPLPKIKHGGPFQYGGPLRLQQGDTPIQAIVRQIDDISFCMFLFSKADRQRGVKALLQLGADPNVTDSNGNSILQMSLDDMDHRLIAPLIWHGADLSVKYDDGTTILQRVCSEGNVNLAGFLIDHGADVNEVSGPYRTALYIAYRNAVCVPIDSGTAESSTEMSTESYVDESVSADRHWTFYDKSSGAHPFGASEGSSEQDSNDEAAQHGNKCSGDDGTSCVSGYRALLDTSSANSSGSVEQEKSVTQEYLKMPHNNIRMRNLASLHKQLEEGIMPSALPHDDERLAMVRYLLEMGAKFRWEDYDGFDDEDSDEVELLEFLVQGFEDYLEKPANERGLRDRFRRPSTRADWEMSQRKFYGGSDGLIMMRYKM